MAYNIQPLGGFNVGNALGDAMAQRENRAQLEQKQQEESQIKALTSQAATGDVKAIEQLWGVKPEMAQFMEEREAKKVADMGVIQAQESKRAETDWGIRWKQANTQESKDALLQEAIGNPLIDIDDDDVGTEGEQADLAVNTMLFGHLGKDGYKQLNIGGKEAQNKGLSAEAISFKDLIKDFTPKQQKLAKQVKAGLKGRAVSNAIMTGVEDGTITSYAQAQAEIKQATKFAEATGASRAKMIDKGFEKVTKIEAATRNMDRAITVLNEGAGVGVFEKMWPSIASASVELDNIRGDMALDVVGATTFGALSAGELSLAKDVALPTGLDTEELIDYLGRKKAAQTKLKDYYMEQIQFLDQGGTVAGFLRAKEKEASGAGASQDNQAMEWAKANPNDPRAAAILQKLQGNQ